MITYPADKSKEAIPTLSPLAWGKNQNEKNLLL